MSAYPVLGTRPDPWRLLRLALVLAVVVILTLLVSVEAPDWATSIPEEAAFQLLVGAVSAFAALILAAARRGFRGSSAVSLALALAAAATATAIPIIAIHDWEPARWFLRLLLVEPFFAHRMTITACATLWLFRLFDRHQPPPSSDRRRFALELLPLLVWAFESSSNHRSLFEGHYYYSGEFIMLWWFAESMVSELVALVVTILLVALIARFRSAPTRPRGLLATALAIATVLLDRALSLVVLVWMTADSASR